MLSKNSANSVITAIYIRAVRMPYVWFDKIKVSMLQKVDSRHVEKKLKLLGLYLRRHLSYSNEILYNVVRRHTAACQQF